METRNFDLKPKKKSAMAAGTTVTLPNGLGKMPPQALELEAAVLGALMLEKDALTTVIDILKPNSFYKDAPPAHLQGHLWRCSISRSPSISSRLPHELRETGRAGAGGGPYYVAQLTCNVNSAANIEFHARIITETAIKRELISISGNVLQQTRSRTPPTYSTCSTTPSRRCLK